MVVRRLTRLERVEGRTVSDKFRSVVRGPIVVVGVTGRALRDVTGVGCVTVNTAGLPSEGGGTGGCGLFVGAGVDSICVW